MERRDFIKMLGLAGTSATAYAACSSYMREALAQSTTIDELLNTAAHCQGGSLKDVEHVIFLMQENRSFDHYYGTLRGVRGFGDPRPLRLRNGNRCSPSRGRRPLIGCLAQLRPPAGTTSRRNHLLRSKPLSQTYSRDRQGYYRTDQGCAGRSRPAHPRGRLGQSIAEGTVEGVKPGGSPIEVTDYAQIIGGKVEGDYAHAIQCPNGYLLEFSGNSLDPLQTQLPNIIEMKSADDGNKLQIVFEKWQTASSKLKLINAYSGTEQVIDKAKEVSGTTTVEIATKDGWYDVAVVDSVNANNFLRRYAGHLENGKISKSDPAIGLEYDAKKRAYIGMVA
ncbi:hypothetical protein CU102_00885 [Phyllobacterium brassicacearum]|uniref:Phospholipase C n=1 Tax=Phyllobacterium brassicacearum TaxID=314235 RepID=A0A2P7BW15_9HYPH|nr:alkaline phosphatase family protein [Phyllobacterium brassicacearum]PSH70643.1 hypothetical protein CU102_00885 [Phyllobacterium brassicacearum]TDQ35889.1 phosphoesterase family protein [Phyllobacterium brassicacearum]